MKSRRGGAAREAGFTLLEVLAAVMIFAVWFTWLAGAIMGGVAREAGSHHRLQASLLADRVLADFEAQMLIGGASSLDGESYSDDLYAVTILQEPFDPSAALGGGAPAGIDAGALAAAGGSSPVFKVRIDVNWLDGFDELGVSRTTYSIDRAALSAIAGAVGSASGSTSSSTPNPTSAIGNRNVGGAGDGTGGS